MDNELKAIIAIYVGGAIFSFGYWVVNTFILLIGVLLGISGIIYFMIEGEKHE